MVLLSLTAIIDNLLNRLKWPAATLSAIGLPLSLYAFFQLLGRCFLQPLDVLPLVAGAVGCMLAWRNFAWVVWLGNGLITLEHELTHAIFAWLTGHKVVSFKASMKRGGRVKFIGEGNWLITVAPYFFPTAAFVLLLPAILMPFSFLPWPEIALGIALGFHLISTWIETHKDQSDLQKLGWTFCWLFLPTANVIAVAMLIAFAHDGFSGIQQYFSDCWQLVVWIKESLLGSKQV